MTFLVCSLNVAQFFKITDKLQIRSFRNWFTSRRLLRFSNWFQRWTIDFIHLAKCILLSLQRERCYWFIFWFIYIDLNHISSSWPINIWPFIKFKLSFILLSSLEHCFFHIKFVLLFYRTFFFTWLFINWILFKTTFTRTNLLTIYIRKCWFLPLITFASRFTYYTFFIKTKFLFLINLVLYRLLLYLFFFLFLSFLFFLLLLFWLLCFKMLNLLVDP